MKTWIVNVREKEGKKDAENTLLFNVALQEKDLNIISCGWRVSRGAILAPSYLVRAGWQTTFIGSQEVQKVIYNAVKEIVSKYPKIKPVVKLADAVYTWALSPEMLRKFAPELFSPDEDDKTEPDLSMEAYE